MRSWFCFLTVLGLIACASCHKENERGVRVDSKLAAFIPPGTTLLGGVNVDSLKASAFYQRHAGELNLPMLNASSERLGLDIRRDVSDVLVTWQSNQPIVMARGTFSAKDLQPKIVSLGTQESRYRDRDLFGNGDEAVFFPKQNILLAGSLSALHSLIDSNNGGIPAPIQTRLESLPKTDQVWAVSTQGLPVDRIPMRSELSSALGNLMRYVAGASVGMGVDEGTHFQANITCISADGAKQVHDALRGGIGMARLMTKDNDLSMLHLYDAVQVVQDGESVHVHADLSPELSDQLLRFANRAWTSRLR
ncbi:MAG: hypothetical protein M3Y57_14800 [Acidobacteriota bacterium]|nr:hypothetical protein [Acidobacteriota bacterium]